MKQTSENIRIYPGFWKGKLPSDAVIEHTCYKAGEVLENRYDENAKDLGVMHYKPAHALSTAHDNTYEKNLFAIHDKVDQIVGYVGVYAGEALAQLCIVFLDLSEDEPKLTTNAPYSRCIYYPIIAMMLKEENKFAYLYQKLCTGLKYNAEGYEDCFFEKNKKSSFEKVVDAIYSKINEMFPADTENVYEIFGADQQGMFKFINQGYLEDVSGWVHLDCNEKEAKLIPEAKTVGIFDEDTEIKKTKMPFQDASKENGNSLSENDFAKFLTTDWSIMSDDEAKKLPPFLKIQRKAMHDFYESNKKTLSYEVALKIKEIHDGKLKTLSFSGPAGTGKTFAARMIAGALNLPLQIVVGKAGIDSSEYLGSYQIVSKHGETNSVWKDGAITEVVRYGGILLFDEINLAEPEVVGSLNTLLDISNCLCLSNGETLPANDKFFYIEAMNIGSGFDGTNKMNNSHRRRMQRKMRFALPTKKQEIAILKETTGYTNESILSKLIAVEDYIRSNIEDPTNQYVSISEVQSWISEAEYTGEWIQSACDTVLAPLMEQDETYTDYSLDTITQCGGFVFDCLSYIQDVLSEEKY